MKGQTKGTVLVVGGGISGIQAALDLAEAGFYCHLVESRPSIGGVMAQLDKTFPTNDCSACILSPKLVEAGRHPSIEIHTLTDLVGLEGTPGAFTAYLKKRPRYVRVDKCIACGQCAQKCPKKVKDEFNLGLGTRKAIFLQYPQAVPLKYAIDPDNCIYLKRPGRCGFCKEVCPAQAIDFDEGERRIEIEVGAVLLAPGFSPFDPTHLDFLGYGVFKNVVTSLEFERILSPSGPTNGELVLPGMGTPKKIAWLQCVGSRDIAHAKHPYCSSVCCMYAVKQAVIAREHADYPLDTAIFFMDQRTGGKGFEEYAKRAQDQGVRFIHSRIHTVLEGERPNTLKLRYAGADGTLREEAFDLLVLSVGLEPGKETRELSRTLGLELNEYGFIKTKETGLETSRPGVFALGAAREPKDIPSAVMEASAGAEEAGRLLSKARWTALPPKAPSKTRRVFEEPPRIGVFVCHCGINIGSVVDVREVAEFAKGLPGVVFTQDNLFTCSQDTINSMIETIKREGLNRVVVASCSPRTHEALFQETLEEAGINRYLFEMANIRDQDSWVHQGEPDKATQKAKDLVRMAVEKVRLKKELSSNMIPVEKTALVVGAGVAGMTAALEIADQGFHCVLVERKDRLGGHARKFLKTWQGTLSEDIWRGLSERVMNHPEIDLRLGTEVMDVKGSIGSFETILSDSTTIRHGVTVLAVGAESFKPKKHAHLMESEWGMQQFLHGVNPNCYTLLELDQALMDEERTKEIGTKKSAVFVHCVGSRIPERPYCSKVCCTHAITQALHLKELNPDMTIFCLYRDIRTYGGRERLYEEARRKGILFVRYSLDDPPVVTGDPSSIEVSCLDPITGKRLMFQPELLVLASAVRPRDDVGALSRFFKCALDANGFFLEAHMKLRPVDFATAGVFMCGLCHYPKPMEETITQAKAAAARAVTILAKDVVTGEAITALVDTRKCTGCGLCVEICPFGAVSLDADTGQAKVDTGLCKGCGACVAGCRSGAITLPNEGNQEVMAALDGVLLEW